MVVNILITMLLSSCLFYTLLLDLQGLYMLMALGVLLYVACEELPRASRSQRLMP